MHFNFNTKGIYWIFPPIQTFDIERKNCTDSSASYYRITTREKLWEYAAHPIKIHTVYKFIRLHTTYFENSHGTLVTQRLQTTTIGCKHVNARRILTQNAKVHTCTIYPRMSGVAGVHTRPEPEEIHDLGDEGVLVAAAFGQRRHDVVVVHHGLLRLLPGPPEDVVAGHPGSLTIVGRRGDLGCTTSFATVQNPQEVLGYAPPEGRSRFPMPLQIFDFSFFFF